MPSRPPRLCAQAGCPDFAVIKGRCRQHQTAEYRRIERTRGTATQRGYDADWRRVREQALHRDRRQCVLCRAAGHIRVATEVDHIVPLEQDRTLRLVLSNLRSLCADCHTQRHAGERRRA